MRGSRLGGFDSSMGFMGLIVFGTVLLREDTDDSGEAGGSVLSDPILGDHEGPAERLGEKCFGMGPRELGERRGSLWVGERVGQSAGERHDADGVIEFGRVP